ncbi:hypothetical protein WJX74_001252 [Apatococcus lobatus]|uniref:Uncharacterized protein n=1 Tax=Apatococcus lobatus TaxID=904363 RepID=A0AAW1PYA4_9CHLO
MPLLELSRSKAELVKGTEQARRLAEIKATSFREVCHGLRLLLRTLTPGSRARRSHRLQLVGPQLDSTDASGSRRQQQHLTQPAQNQ